MNNQRDTRSELTVRAQNMNELLTQDIGNARWLRNITRELDMLKEKNAPLYYPITSVRGEGNLFSTIFKLAVEGVIPIYENPISGDEVFDDDHILDIKKGLLDPYDIMYETVRVQGGESYIINENDIPSGLVKAFYVKEAWYFDQNNSVFDVKILALSPLFDLYSDFGSQQRAGMFWVLYEDIRPYVANRPIMISNINNARTYTIDDYFRRRMYEGDIVKTENLMNLPLQAYAGETPEAMQQEQQRIEDELVAFEKALWFQPDSARLVAPPTKKAARAARTTVAKQPKAPKQPKTVTPKASASASSGSSSSRSIRR
jgi:gliding motility associated protien GldN